MAQAGWYDDPDGTPRRWRYWDGAQWTTHTQYPPAPAAPFGAPSPAPPPQRTGGRGGLSWLVGIAVILATGVLVLVFVVPPGSAPGGAAPSPQAPSGRAETPAIACPSAGSERRLSDGWVAVAVPTSWTARATPEWADCGSGAQREVEPGWVTVAMVGTFSADPGTTAEQVAQEVWRWNASRNYGGEEAREDVVSAAATRVQGTNGWRIAGEVAVDGAADLVTVLALPRPDGRITVVFTVSTVGDQPSTDEVASIWSSLKVG